MVFYHNIRQTLYISLLILCFIFNICLPIYKHVYFNPKQSPRILYLSIILESLKNTLPATLFDSNASFLNQEKNIEEPYFSVSLEDTDEEKEVTNGAPISIDDDPLTYSLFSMSSIIDSEIYVPYLSHFVHTSLIDGA